MPDLRVANAPVSFGAFELTVGRPDVPDPAALLDAVSAAGYDGIDLGPPGFLGDDGELKTSLDARRLALAGGFLSLPLATATTFAELRPEVDEMLDLLELAAGDPAPRPTIADAGSPERFARPGQAQLDRALGLDELGWNRLAENLNRVTERCRERELEPTFHPHAGTHVEAGWEVERLLGLSDVGLCFDSGHLAVGGVDPVTALREWGSRINHFHLKDVDRAALDAALAARVSLDELFQRRVFCAFGAGDVALVELCRMLSAGGHGGWLVVEQDIFPGTDATDLAVRDQVANREFLRALGI